MNRVTFKRDCISLFIIKVTWLKNDWNKTFLNWICIKNIKYNHLIIPYCFFVVIRLCSDTQNTSLYHKTWSPITRVSIYSYDTNHLITRFFQIRRFLFRFQMVFDKTILLLPVFKLPAFFLLCPKRTIIGALNYFLSNYNRLSMSLTARGSRTCLVTVGPTKV